MPVAAGTRQGLPVDHLERYTFVCLGRRTCKAGMRMSCACCLRAPQSCLVAIRTSAWVYASSCGAACCHNRTAPFTTYGHCDGLLPACCIAANAAISRSCSQFGPQCRHLRRIMAGLSDSERSCCPPSTLASPAVLHLCMPAPYPAHCSGIANHLPIPIAVTWSAITEHSCQLQCMDPWGVYGRQQRRRQARAMSCKVACSRGRT